MQFFKQRDVWWWLGVPFVVGALTWLPYIVLNLLAKVHWSPWRVPFVPIVLFDSGAYFEWIGPALYGYPAGTHIRSFVWILRGLEPFIPGSWSMAEVWLFTLWISMVVGVWVMASAIQRWSGLSKLSSRLFASLLWVVLVVPFMGRPGVFTWYAPFYAFGLIAVLKVQAALSERRYLRALAWTFGTFIASWAYPYFLVHLTLWLAGMWFVCMYTRSRRLVVGMSVGMVACLPFLVWMFTPVLMRSSAALSFEVQTRMGLAFTRLPVLSNSLVLVGAWIIFLLLLLYARSKSDALFERLRLLTIGWITLMCAWLSNLLTSVYIHNDHFRGPAVFLSWVSLAFVYASFKETSEERRWMRIVSGLIMTLSFLACAWYVVVRRFVFTGDYLNVVHVTHWLALAVASMLVWRRAAISVSYRFWMGLGVACFLLGFSARAYLFIQERHKFPLYVPYVSTIRWIHYHVPFFDDVCTDSAGGDILGSFTGRMVHPSFAAIALPKPDAAILAQLETQLGYYDAQASRGEAMFHFTFGSMRGSVCTQFPFWERLFKKLGYTQAEFLAFAGCPEEDVRRDELRVREYLLSRRKYDDRFRALCPVVVVSRDQRAYWDLPHDYQETKIDERFSIWRSLY